MIILYIVLALAMLVCLVCAFWLIPSLIALIIARGVPFVPLGKKELNSINKFIKLTPTDRVVDLGSGDGRVLRLFERQGVDDLTGYEINLWPHIQAKIYNFFTKSKSKVYLRNFFNVDLAQFNIVFCYLLEGCLTRLTKKFDSELKPGTKIVSYAFEIKNWHTPTEIIYTSEKKDRDRIFIYEIK